MMNDVPQEILSLETEEVTVEKINCAPDLGPVQNQEDIVYNNT